MISNEELQNRLKFRKAALTAAREAYLALLEGQVQSYAIGSRNLTKFDLPKLWEEIKSLEKEVDELESAVNGKKRRKAVGVIPRDW